MKHSKQQHSSWSRLQAQAVLRDLPHGGLWRSMGGAVSSSGIKCPSSPGTAEATTLHLLPPQVCRHSTHFWQAVQCAPGSHVAVCPELLQHCDLHILVQQRSKTNTLLTHFRIMWP